MTIKFYLFVVGFERVQYSTLLPCLGFELRGKKVVLGKPRKTNSLIRLILENGAYICRQVGFLIMNFRS